MLTPDPSRILRAILWASFVLPTLIAARAYVEVTWAYPTRVGLGPALWSVVGGREHCSDIRSGPCLFILPVRGVPHMELAHTPRRGEGQGTQVNILKPSL